MIIDNNSYFCKFYEYIIKLMEAIVKFFRRRAINAFQKHKKTCILPDIGKYPTIAILLDEEQFKRYKDIERTLTKFFVMKRYTFIVLVNALPKDVMQTDRYYFIRKEDFNFWGLMKLEKKESLISLSFDMVVDFSKSSDADYTHSYIMTLINNTFRVTFGSNCPSIYDMVIDSKKDDDILDKIEILRNYLSMLLGRR